MFGQNYHMMSQMCDKSCDTLNYPTNPSDKLNKLKNDILLQLPFAMGQMQLI